jgi:diacylglycerol diphosphate phosphatase/phosphatidate phosphatase
MRVNNRRGYTWKAWVLLAPFTCGILVPVSRSMDYRHHATDLIAGSLIGILTAWVGYRSYYPVSYILSSLVNADKQNLGHPQAYKPYSPRIAKDEVLPLNNRTSAETSAFIPTQANTSGQNQWNGAGAQGNEHLYPPLSRKDDNGHNGFSEVSERNETVERGS